VKLATDESMVLQESDVYHCTKSTFETNMFACMFASRIANAVACSRRSDSGARAKNKASERAEKNEGDWGRGRRNTCEINFKKPMPPTLDRRQRQRNMNPGSDQSKQESYVIMFTEIGFSLEFEALGKVLVML